MGGAGGGSSGAKNAAKNQAAIVRDLFAQTEKGRGAGIDQILNVLQTGGRGAMVPPIIKNATSSVDLATNSTIADVVAAGNKVGGGTQFTKAMVPSLTQQGGMNREAARGALVTEMLGKAPEVGVSGVQLATQGLSGLVRRGAAEQTAKAQRNTQIATTAGAAGGAIAAAVIAYFI